MVIKEELLKDIEKLSPEERLKRLKELEEQIKLEEKITQEIIVKEKEELREKQEIDEILEEEERKKREEQRKKELEEVVEEEKIKEQEEELATRQVEYHARLVSETDQALNRWQDMNKQELTQYQSQAKDMYEKLNEAYTSAAGWIRDDIKAEKERLKKTFGINEEWWEKMPGDEYVR